MKCEVCQRRLNKNWNFCPNCGIMVGSSDLAEFLNRQIKHITKKLENMMYLNDSDIPQNITIAISPYRLDTKPKGDLLNHKPFKLPENVVEPETNIRKIDNELIFYLKLPGVKKKEDINLQIFSNSVEVRAIAGDKGYFKIINIPSHYSLVHKKFENEELVLHFNYF